MKTVILACKMLEQELRHVLAEAAGEYRVVWFEKGLHNSPDRLRDALQAQLDALDPDVGRVIFTYGYCGGCISGLHVNAETIFPRVDDCITMLLGSHSRRLEFSDSGTGAFYLTEAWLDSDRSIVEEYNYAMRRYGEKRARRILDAMFHNYSTIVLLDTGLSPIDPTLEKARKIAQALDFSVRIVPATLGYLRALVSGPWLADRFVVLPPGESLTPLQAGTMMNGEGSTV